MLAPHVLSDLIGSIYEAALDPTRWEPALDDLRGHLRCHNAVLGVNTLPDGRLILSATAGVEEPWRRTMNDFPEDLLDAWGGPAIAYAHPINEPAVGLRINPGMHQMAHNRYLREWCDPQGIIDGLTLVLARDAGAIGTLAFGRHRDVGPVDDAAVALARLLLPHLQRAAAIGRLMESQRARAEELQGVMDALRSPVLIVTAARQIVHANPAARVLLDTGAPLVDQGGQLVATAPRVHRQLVRAIERACAGNLPSGSDAVAVSAPTHDGVRAMYVVPLPRTPRVTRLGEASGEPATATAAVFVATPRAWPGQSGQLAGALFGLTPAEVRVFEGIAAGRSPADVAATLGVAPSTVRTHLLRIYAKTGVHRQSELTRLAAGMAAPVG